MFGSLSLVFFVLIITHASCKPKVNTVCRDYGCVVYPDPSDDTGQLFHKDMWIGNIFSGLNTEFVRENGITHVIDLSGGSSEREYESYGVKRKGIEVDDHTSSDIYFPVKESLEYIKEARETGGVVLIHCAAGVSRSSSVAIAYLMCTQNMDYDTAYKTVKTARYVIEPNEGFASQLKQLDCKKLGV